MDKLSCTSTFNNLQKNLQIIKNEPAKEQQTCFDDSDWCDNAANAISEQFEDMDSFLDLFIKSQN